jgi:predicted hydrocarbon binding protein
MTVKREMQYQYSFNEVYDSPMFIYHSAKYFSGKHKPNLSLSKNELCYKYFVNTLYKGGDCRMKKDNNINRRNLFKLGCSAAIGAGMFNMVNLNAAEATNDEKVKKHVSWWIDRTLKNTEKCRADGDCKAVIECTGRDCAKEYITSHVIKLKGEMKDSATLAELVEALDSKILGGGHLEINGNVVTATYKKCYCPTGASGIIKSPLFCNCSKGWIKEVMEVLTGKKVKVETVSTIIAGGSKCQFKVTV